MVYLIQISVCFNPHTHTGCDSEHANVPRPYQGFNPHTHTGCDEVLHDERSRLYVSIHTPIQGVTTIDEKDGTRIFVSIHTPIQGVTSSPSSRASR